KASQVRAVARVGAAMIDGGQPLVLPYHQPKGVVELLAVVEFAALEHLLHERRAADLWVVEVFIPLLKIFDRGMKAGGSDGIEIRDADFKWLPRLLFIPNRVVLDDFRVIVTEVRVGHAERPEDILRRVLTERHPADSLDDQSHQRVTGIAVDVPVARLEVE